MGGQPGPRRAAVAADPHRGRRAVYAITAKTTYGRHIYAVGGNAEAARRAGISVPWVRTGVFVLASTLAAAGGILLVSRLLAVNQSSGGSDCC